MKNSARKLAVFSKPTSRTLPVSACMHASVTLLKKVHKTCKTRHAWAWWECHAVQVFVLEVLRGLLLIQLNARTAYGNCYSEKTFQVWTICATCWANETTKTQRNNQCYLTLLIHNAIELQLSGGSLSRHKSHSVWVKEAICYEASRKHSMVTTTSMSLAF